MIGLLTGVWGKIAAVAAIVGAVMLAVAKIFAAGRRDEQAQGMQEQLKNVETRNQTDASVGAASDSSVRDELREKFTSH